MALFLIDKQTTAVPFQTCFHFKRGACRNGTNCKFLHSSLVSPKLANNICTFFQSGRCRFGLLCKDVHEGVSLHIDREQPHIPCRFFAIGGCKAGNSCRFAHVAPVNESVAAHTTSSAAESPEVLTMPCKYHAAGNCQRGLDCKFGHTTPHNGNVAAEVCQSWSDGGDR